jgi:hypothetical protein
MVICMRIYVCVCECECVCFKNTLVVCVVYQ